MENEKRDPWHIRLDLRDMMAGVGVLLMAGGAWFLHPALPAVLAGAGLTAFAVIKARGK